VFWRLLPLRPYLAAWKEAAGAARGRRVQRALQRLGLRVNHTQSFGEKWRIICVKLGDHDRDVKEAICLRCTTDERALLHTGVPLILSGPAFV
jgi:hypothetical protein